MNSDTPLDFALFQLSPRRSRCELLASGGGRTEKLASGFFKPFASHLRVEEEQTSQSIKLEVDKQRNGSSAWFNKGTLERFVRFVSTPEVLELVNTSDAEMCQLEGTRKMYSQVAADQLAGASDAKDTISAEAADTTKKGLLRAIDMRLAAVEQDLIMAFSRASAAGFTIDSVSELLCLSDRFSAHRLNDACTKFVSLCKRRPELVSLPNNQPQWKGFGDGNVRSSSGSDMSIDEPEVDGLEASVPAKPLHKRSVSCSGQLQESTLVNVNASAILKQPKPVMQRSVEGGSHNSTGPPIPAEPTPATGACGPRRLSVQDRINLFESKQKDSNNGSTATSGGMSKLSNGNAELRRLPSDGSGEKSVLRRWSGSSDMSIDLGNNDRKDSSIPAMTPSSSTNSHSQTSCKTEGREAGLKDTATSLSSWADRNDNLARAPSKLKDGSMDAASKEQKFNSDLRSNTGLKHELLRPLKQSEAYQTGAEYGDLKNSFACLTQNEDDINPTPPSVSAYRDAHQTQFKAVIQGNVEVPERRHMQIPSEAVDTLTEHVQEVKGYLSPLPRSFPLSIDDGEMSQSTALACSKVTSKSNVQIKPTSGGTKLEESSRKEPTPRTLAKDFIQKLDSEKMMLQRKASSPGQISNIHEGQTNNVQMFKGMNAKGNMDIVDPLSAQSAEQVRLVRSSKGNQELNDELQLKADELERLFSAHKLRTFGDVADSSRRNQAADAQGNHGAKSSEALSDQFPYWNLFSGSMDDGVNCREYANNVNNTFMNLGPLEELRGKFYEKYKQKRDTKLREVWVSKRVQKEAELKAMHDSLEHSKAEMRVKLARSNSRQDGRCLEGNVRTRLVTDTKEQKVDGYHDVEGGQEIFEQVHCDAHFSDGSSHVPLKKLPYVESNSSSSTPRILTGQVTRSSGKAANSASQRRSVQMENPLVQSIPNFSEVRKEYARPSLVASKINHRNSNSKIARSRSTSKELNCVKEDKQCRSQSMRKNLAVPGESKDTSHFNLDGDIFVTAQKGNDSEAFFGNGDCVGPETGDAISRLQASAASELDLYGEDSERLEQTPEIVRDENEEFLGESIEENSNALDFYADSNSGNLALRQESGYRRNPVLETNGTLGLASQADDILATTSSKFNASAGNTVSPTESPTLWNLRAHHLNSFAPEASDASLDSPSGSPASWNSHPLNQVTKVDAARMRKKWGSAQVPVLVPNVLHQQRKDQAKGLKHLFKFGRKNKGPECLLNDCVSASTASECDDDIEDVREVGLAPSDDLRKSRMCLPVSSYDGFTETDTFHKQAPHSFFSLSSFRSKGAESKP